MRYTTTMEPQPTVTYSSPEPQAYREKLVSQMAICTQPERVTRRYTYDVINAETKALTGYVRLAAEQSRIALHFTAPNEQGAAGMPEVTLGVSDFDTANMLLHSLGLQLRSLQELKQEIWETGTVKVIFESWPWLDPLIHVSAPTAEEATALASQMGLPPERQTTATVPQMYGAKYGIDESVFVNTPELIFMKRPEWVS
jgi:hypothetical protein